ncbi:MAG: Acetophenone carboxylase gamma subunit [Alphaproteobacteria bacterium MarineAlpha5_Bin9]|nr:MAG: Acetophenone carboxylase gamma subunit [Alphaproteobacteria bacterium MarineAlpha5_Bin9]|tara:strand:+ start:23466 stop:25538 length:2073 start_codon:yes stop_codon:yes gene_type:complete
MLRIATDVGGTFTDLVYFEIDDNNGKALSIKTAKSDTTPSSYEKGVFDAITKAKVKISDSNFFAHGTTVVINSITERKGVQTGLITTKGFRDSIEIARGDRPDFFNMQYQKPKPFIPRYLRSEIAGRIDFLGNEITPLDLTNLNSILDNFRKHKVKSIAVCLIHSYANSSHELKVVEQIKKNWPEIDVVSSHQITREWREYERTNTTALCAYIKPIARNYLDKLNTKLKESNFSGNPYVMQSNGGIDTFESTKNIPLTMIESGPTSGVLGAAELGNLINEKNIITLDVGGTTAKCSLIENGNVKINTNYWIEKNRLSAGYPVMLPVVDIVEIGNGGGSIAWVDDYNKLHVGPQSAGADPGPVSYGKGGTSITTTDANLITNRINQKYFCGGEIEADMQSVDKHIEPITEKLNFTKDEAARGIIRIANNNMINALKLVSVNKGYDPRDFTLVAFGGGGGMHATSLAKDLNIPKVIIPVNSSVFSAWGMLMSDLRRDYILTKLTTMNEEATKVLKDTFDEMEKAAYKSFEKEEISKDLISFKRFGSFRYLGQDHSVEIPIKNSSFNKSSILEIINDFHNQYEKEFTYKLDSQVDMIQFHLVAFAKINKPDLQERKITGMTIEKTIKEKRKVDFDQMGIHESNIYDFNLLEPKMEFYGPAIVEDPSTTVVIFPNQKCNVDKFANLHISILEES